MRGRTGLCSGVYFETSLALADQILDNTVGLVPDLSEHVARVVSVLEGVLGTTRHQSRTVAAFQDH